jgi:hypothetical protein
MITHDQMIAIDRFADELRKQFDIKGNPVEFSDKIKNIYYSLVWDIIALVQEKFREEFEEWSTVEVSNVNTK